MFAFHYLDWVEDLERIIIDKNMALQFNEHNNHPDNAAMDLISEK